MFKLDSLHVVLMVALLGVSVNLGIQLCKSDIVKSNSVAQYKTNENAMQEACQKNPNLLVCNMSKESK